jgi:hypothetical protein
VKGVTRVSDPWCKVAAKSPQKTKTPSLQQLLVQTRPCTPQYTCWPSEAGHTALPVNARVSRQRAARSPTGGTTGGTETTRQAEQGICGGMGGPSNLL